MSIGVSEKGKALDQQGFFDKVLCCIEIVASAIQATAEAVKDWSSGVAIAATDGAVLTVATQ